MQASGATLPGAGQITHSVPLGHAATAALTNASQRQVESEPSWPERFDTLESCNGLEKSTI